MLSQFFATKELGALIDTQGWQLAQPEDIAQAVV
jgi:hypothetical protein